MFYFFISIFFSEFIWNLEEIGYFLWSKNRQFNVGREHVQNYTRKRTCAKLYNLCHNRLWWSHLEQIEYSLWSKIRPLNEGKEIVQNYTRGGQPESQPALCKYIFGICKRLTRICFGENKSVLTCEFSNMTMLPHINVLVKKSVI